MFTVHEEQETHFVVSRDGGAPFAVVKHGLLPDTITRVRAMLPQKMANGGNPVPEVSANALLRPEDLLQPQSIAPAPVEPPAMVWPSERERLAGITDADLAAQNLARAAELDRNRAYTRWAQTGEGEKPGVAAPGPGLVRVQIPQAQLDAAYGAPSSDSATKAPAATSNVAPAQIAPSPPNVAAAAQGDRDKLMSGFERGSESPAERSQREAEADIEKKGQIQQAGFEQQQSELQRQEAERQKLVSDLQAQRKANDDALTEWAKKEPDQGRWWSSKSTGNKIGSGIAMILGGFFSGISGQKNQALQVIEDSIAKDVQSQVDQKNSMVHRLMENGRSINEAFQLAHAGLLEATANRMEQIRAGMAAQSVGPDTDLAIKGLRAQAEQIKQSAALKGLEAQKTASEIAKNQAEATKLYAEAGKAGREGRGAVYGQRIGSEQLGQLSKEERTRFVHVGDGQWMPAASEEQAKLATGQLESGRNLSRSINALDAYLKKGTLVKGTEDYAGAKAAANAMMGPMRSILGLGVLSEADKDLVSSLVAHPEELFTLGSTSRGRLRELRRMANQSFANAYDRLGVTVPETTAR